MTLLNYLWLAGIAAFLVYSFFRLKTQLHMMQLNTYRNDRYTHWLSEQYHPEYRDLLLLLAIGPLWFGSAADGYVSLFIWIVGFLIMLRFVKGEPAKKPLVFTARARRLFACVLAVYVVVTAVVCWGMVLSSLLVLRSVGLLALVAMLFAVPYFLLLANSIMAPLEERRNRGYFEEAQKLMAENRDLMKIAVTGSYGKTSVKHVIDAIMRQRYETLMPPGSYNTPMGLTRVIREQLKPLHQVFVTEMGAKQRGDIAELCTLVQPNHGLLTALGEQHLESFGSFENIIDTKFELIEALPENGVAVLNFDDENIRANAHRARARVVSYGLHSDDLDYRAVNIRSHSRGTEFTIETPTGVSESFRSQLLGEHNVYNITGAVALCCELGLTLTEARRAVAGLPPVEHRLQLKVAANGLVIIDDAFNSNPAGARAAMEVLGAMAGGRKFLITPGMVELGEREAELNREFGRQAAAACNYIALVGLRQTQPIYEGLMAAGFPEAQLLRAEDLQAANTWVYGRAVAGDIILYENDLPDTYNEK